MYRNFKSDCLSIFTGRGRENNEIILNISSDYAGDCRKQQLYVNEKRLAEQVECSWKSIKTKKLKKLIVSFGEEDHYDDMTDIYDTPVVHIERGLKKARIGYHEHGSIPKDWSFNLTAIFGDTTTNTAILEVIKKSLGSKFDKEIEKKFINLLRPFLQKKVTSANFYAESED